MYVKSSAQLRLVERVRRHFVCPTLNCVCLSGLRIWCHVFYSAITTRKTPTMLLPATLDCAAFLRDLGAGDCGGSEALHVAIYIYIYVYTFGEMYFSKRKGRQEKMAEKKMKDAGGPGVSVSRSGDRSPAECTQQTST